MKSTKGHDTTAGRAIIRAPQRLFRLVWRRPATSDMALDLRAIVRDELVEEIIQSTSYSLPHPNVVVFVDVYYEEGQEVPHFIRSFQNWVSVEELTTFSGSAGIN